MKKQKLSTLPLLFAGVALLVVSVYGLIRYFLLADGFDREVLFRVLWETVPAIAVVLLFGLFCLLYGHRNVTRPVVALKKRVEGILKEKPSEPVAAKGEIGELSQALFARQLALSDEIAAFGEETADKTRELVEAELAETIRSNGAERAFGGLMYGVASRRRGATEGADITEGFLLGKKYLFFAIGEVWGNGLPAALYALRVKELLREYVPLSSSLQEAIVAVNAALLAERKELYATLFAAVFCPDTGELHYVNAGQAAPIVMGETCGFLRLRAGEPLGAFEDFSVREEFYALRPGQGLFLYTSGLVGAANEHAEPYGYDRLFAALREEQGSALDAGMVAEGVMRALGAHLAERQPKECAAALVLWYPHGVQRQFRAVAEESRGLEALLSEWLAADPRKSNLSAACVELFRNITAHAGAKTIRVSCEREEGHLIVRLTDDGEPFDPLHAAADGGNAVGIVHALGGEIFYRTKQELNVLTIRLPARSGL